MTVNGSPASLAPHRPSWIPGLALRFFAFSVPLFLLWQLWLRDPYLAFLARVFVTTARLFRLDVQVVQVSRGEIRLAYHDYEWGDDFGMTGINTVALAALVLATGFLGWRKRLQLLPVALVLLIASQVLGLWTDIVHVHLHENPSMVGFANGLREFMTGFGTFLFPVLIWLALVRRHLPIRAPD
jgi:hypothetical protein